MSARKVLIPLPSRDFDPTESAVPWQILRQAGVEVVIATPDGARAKCDPIMLTGDGLGLLARTLMADSNACEAYQDFSASAEFLKPIMWADARATDFEGIILPGGHAKGMKPYLESPILQNLVVDFFAVQKPVGAICHGVVLAARSKVDGKSVLFGRKTTALLATQEMLAWSLTCLWMKDYYRTYPETVESEVRRSLAAVDDFAEGPMPLKRDTPKNLKPGFVVRDRNYVSARWPGDAHLFATTFVETLT